MIPSPTPWAARLCSAAAVMLLAAAAIARQPARPASWLCRVKLVSEAEPDMTSVDSILKSIIRPGMTHEQKCMAVYRFVYEHRFWYPSACPYENGRPVYDPLLTVNCFAALICQQDAAVTSGLWAGLGYDVRYWQLGGHTTGEVFYDGQWRNFDATLERFKRDPDGGIADVSVTQRHYKPRVSYVPDYDDFEIGHQMDLTIRRGETFTRHWYPLSKAADYWRPGGRQGRMPDDKKGQRRALETIMKLKPYRADTRGAGFCNGLWEFRPDLADPRWRDVFDSTTNVAVSDGKLLSPKAPGKPAELLWRMRTPYIITGAWLEGEFLSGRGGDALKAFVSTNNGATWQAIGPIKPGRGKLPLREHVAGRFGYLLKLTIGPAKSGAVGVKDLAVRTVVQANPLSLPALKRGKNAIKVSAGEQLATITIYPNLETPAFRAGASEAVNVVTARQQIQPGHVRGLCSREGGKESTLTYKVRAPGEIKQVRWGGRFRAGPGDVNELHWSADGKTWREQKLSNRWTRPGSKARNLYPAYYETTKDLPAGRRTVYLRYRFVRPVPKSDPAEAHLATSIRIAVDYAPAAGSGGVPVEITYCWAEKTASGDTEKTHTEVARKLPHSYNITVAGEGKPLMKWVRMRLVAP